jgi:hypothetical protein
VLACGFPQSLQANAGETLQSRSFPFESFLTHYSLIALSLDAIYFELLAASLLCHILSHMFHFNIIILCTTKPHPFTFLTEMVYTFLLRSVNTIFSCSIFLLGFNILITLRKNSLCCCSGLSFNSVTEFLNSGLNSETSFPRQRTEAFPL